MKKSQDLGSVFDRYIEECKFTKRLRAETVRGYISVFKTFRKIMPEIVFVDQLNANVISLFFKRVESRDRLVGKKVMHTGVKDSTIYTYWTKLNCFVSWLSERGYLDKKFMLLVRPSEPAYDDSRALSKEDIEKIITAINLHSPNLLLKKRDILMISILLFCGLRKNELISIKVTDFLADKRLLVIQGSTSKSKKTRILPVNPIIMMHFEDYIKERNSLGYTTPYLFVSNNEDRGLSIHGQKHWTNKLIKLSKVKFHLHRFRHTFAVNLSKNGTDVVAIQKLLGHKQLKMTQTYLRSSKPEDFMEQVSKLNYDNLI